MIPKVQLARTAPIALEAKTVLIRLYASLKAAPRLFISKGLKVFHPGSTFQSRDLNAYREYRVSIFIAFLRFIKF